ncbi:Protein transport protein Sec24D, partial [Perkinsus olseni]
EKLLGQCSTVLHAYRVNCASSSAPKHTGTQLLLPETLKLMPLYIGGLLKISASGIYLVDNTQVLRLYVGPAVSEETLLELFGTRGMDDFENPIVSPETSDLACRVWCIIQQVRKDKGSRPFQSVRVALPNTPEEARLFATLSEDRIGGEMSYVDLLCHIHRQVNGRK